MNVVDFEARAEELARHLAANFPRLTLARFIAHDGLLPALRGAYGNPAMRDVGGAIAGAVAEFEQSERAAAAAARRQARAAEAERLFTTLAQTRELTGEAPCAPPEAAPRGGASRPILTLAPPKEAG